VPEGRSVRSKYFLLLLAGGLCAILLIFFSGDLRKQWGKFRRGLSDRSVEWETAPLASGGFDGPAIDALIDSLAAHDTWSLLIARHGRIVTEWYAEGAGPEETHYTASLAKSIAGGMALLVALDEDRISLDDPVSEYIPSWRDDPERAGITILQLATHSSGLEDAAEQGVARKDLTGWKREFWRRDPEPFSVVLEHSKPLFTPGTAYTYGNTGFAVLGYALTSSIADLPESSIGELLDRRIMTPIGIPPDTWEISYGKDYELNGLTLHAIWGGGKFTTRAVARIGQLLLDGGVWNGVEIVDPKLVDAMDVHAGTPLPDRSRDPFFPAPAPCWYTNFDGAWSSLPTDAFAGAGNGHQLLLIVPSLDLIVVRFGRTMNGGDFGAGYWRAANELLFEPLMRAIVDPPASPSSVITDVTFAPVDSIVLRARGSDNWPITWADDDHLYTAYGDGKGFEPGTDEKLSLGFAKISGTAESFTGENILSESGERLGDGPAGAKASGLLSLDGVLYMWVRNLGNSQLAWSTDHGATWEWGFKFETSFGSPTFLNAGRDHAGARDAYVYVFSQDGPSAYEPDDGVVLARVARDQIRDRSGYEFFAGTDDGGAPIWTSDIDERAHVLHFPGRCYRSDAVVHPTTRRTLLALAFGREGGWGIFDAPDPWGPWTTAFFTLDWGVGRTHGYRLPSKWISPEGDELHVVFSGKKHDDVNYDAFCVRRATLTLAEDAR